MSRRQVGGGTLFRRHKSVEELRCQRTGTSRGPRIRLNRSQSAAARSSMLLASWLHQQMELLSSSCVSELETASRAITLLVSAFVWMNLPPSLMGYIVLICQLRVRQSCRALVQLNVSKQTCRLSLFRLQYSRRVSTTRQATPTLASGGLSLSLGELDAPAEQVAASRIT